MAGSRISEVETALAASRAGADRRLVEALGQARQLEAEAAATAHAAGLRRIDQLRAVHDAIATQSEAIETAATRLAAAMAATSDQLVALTAGTDFSPPRWRTELSATVARKLEEEA